MPSSLAYTRKFIILKKEFSTMAGRNPKGHCKLEVKGIRGMITVNIENAEVDTFYNFVFISNDKLRPTLELGKVFTDDLGRGRGEYSFTQKELESKNFPIDKISGILIMRNSQVFLGGYIGKEDGSIERYIESIPLKPQIESVSRPIKEVVELEEVEESVQEVAQINEMVKAEMLEKVEETVESEETPEMKVIGEEVNEESINEESINEESVNEESVNEESINEESVNTESINIESVNTESVNTESVNAESVNIESINTESINKESVNAESINTESINIESVNTESINTEPINIESVDQSMYNIPAKEPMYDVLVYDPKYDIPATEPISQVAQEKDIEVMEYEEKVQEEIVESYNVEVDNEEIIQEEISPEIDLEFEDLDEESMEPDYKTLEHIRKLNQKNQTTNYVLSILRYFPYIEPFRYNLKGYNWWLVELDRENEYRAFLPYFSYIVGGNNKELYNNNIATCNQLMNKYGHYLFGLYNEGETVKYFVYGVPGEFSIEEHPYRGNNGFNTWHKGQNTEGYWIIYIDPMTGKAVEPVTPMIPLD